jgi:hypothetical protein
MKGHRGREVYRLPLGVLIFANPICCAEGNVAERVSVAFASSCSSTISPHFLIYRDECLAAQTPLKRPSEITR